jgi:hypothetical protein
MIKGHSEMFKKRKTISETGGDRQIAVSGQGNGRNGHDHPSGLLSWYLMEPGVKGLTNVLTANGYVILASGLPRSRKEIDADELMV